MNTTPFDRAYARVVRKFSMLGAEADKAAAGSVALDDSLTTTARAADKAATSLGRNTAVTRESSVADEKAAAAAARHARAVSEVAGVMGRATAATEREVQAVLRDVAAQQRAVAVRAELGSAAAMEAREIARVAGAEASAIGTTQRLTAVQREAAVATTRLAVAQRETAASSRRMSGGLASGIKMAGELGLVIGGLAIAKKAFEFVKAGKDLTDSLNQVQAVSRASNTQMKAVRSEAIGLGKDLKIPGATAVDATNAILELVKAGIKLPRAMLAARPAMLLAAATQTGMADTARALGDSMDIWSIKGQGAAHAAKILGSATLGASHDLMGLFDAIKQAGPSSQALKIGLDDTATALVYLAKHGLSTEMGGTGLKVMLSTLAKDTPKGVRALQDLGVAAFDAQGKFVGYPKLFDQLHGAYGRFGNDSKRFLHDLTAAFGTRGQSVAALFAKATGKEFEQLKKHLEAGDLQKFADQMNRGVGAGFRQLSKEATAAGIDVYHGLEGPINSVVRLVGAAFPVAFHIAHAALVPFGVAAHALGGVLGPVAHGIGDLVHLLGPVAPVLRYAASGALALFAAFKGYQLVRFAVSGIAGAVDTLRLRAMYAADGVRGSMAGMQARFAGTGAAASVSALQTEAAVTAEAAAVDRAAAVEAVAYADMTAASTASTDVQVADADARAAAALTAARASQEAAVITATAAEEASAAVVASGDAAKIGWAGLAGPLGIAAIAVLSIATMFGRSTSASKEATEAAKAYTEVLKGGGRADLIDSITSQLKKNNVPQTLAALNKQLGDTRYSGRQFVAAIQSGGAPLASLRRQLQASVDAGRAYVANTGDAMPKAAALAQKALNSLNAQYTGLSKATRKDLIDTKAFAGVSSSIDKVSQSTKVGSKEAAQYAQMMGIVVDKNGVAAVSSGTLRSAINTVSRAYNTATSTGSDYLAAVQAFSTSAGTAADRAAMIGAILKNNAGDALSFAGSINTAAVAVTQLGKDVSGKLLHQVVNLKSGTIAYSKTAAAPLINDLGSIQSAALEAAKATYLHNRQLMSGGRAADMAVTRYKGVEDSLVRQLHKSGLSTTAAQRLTDKYLGVPKNVRTLIEQAGADPVVTVLNKIGRLLAKITGQQWDAKINVTASISPSAIMAQNLLNNVRGSNAFRITNKTSQYAAGGTIPPNTRFTVGEKGWEGGVTDAQGRATIIPHAQAKAMGFAAPVGYASGSGSNYAAIAATLRSMGATRAGIAGWLGNTKIESGGRTTAHNPGENAWGFQQWEGGRLDTLRGIASRLHVGITSQAAQLAMIRHELTHGYGDTLHMLRTAKSATSAAAYVDANYERSSGAARGARMSAASAFYRSGVSAATAGSGGGGGVSAVTSQQQLAKHVATAAGSLQKVAHNTHATAAQLKAAGARLTASAAALHASSATLRQAAGYQRAINADAARRTRLYGSLSRAQGAVKTAQQLRSSDYSSFVAPTRDSFNISDASQYAAATTTSKQAGATITTTTPGGVSLASILASDKAAAGAAKGFGADLTALARRGLNKTDVAALAAAGPSADPVAKALLGASRSQIAALNANRSSINSSAGKMAAGLAHRFDDAGVNAAAGLAHGLTSQIGRLDHAIVRLADHMTWTLKRRLRIHSPSQVFHDLGTMLPKGLANGIHEKLPEVRRAVGHMADATNPGLAGWGPGGAGGLHYEQHIHPQPQMSEREIGRAAANDALFRLQTIGGLPT